LQLNCNNKMKRRNTSAKQAVFEILSASRSALSQEDIEQEVKGAMNRVTVYRVLNSFCEDGYIHKILSDDGKHYFAFCRGCKEKKHRHDHVHFRCLNCHRLECMKEELKVKLPKGYKLKTANFLMTGYCRKCS
jgi:Fur family ferric uptake transcriptional regulator